jgi:3-phosphoshikimate 1-carboxyvinyltransferase
MPADKSIAHRALLFAALAEGRSTITVRQPGLDVLSTFGSLRALGLGAESAAESAGAQDQQVFTVDGVGRDGELGRLSGGEVDCGNSGTTIRLLLGALAGADGAAVLTGDASLSRRPMERVAGPLRAMGADITTQDGHPPVRVRGRRPLAGLEHRVPVASAQVLGAISLAALAADGPTTIQVPGPTRDHTERMLAAMGAPISRSTSADGSSATSIDGSAGLRALSLEVPGDFSSAAAWLVLGAVHSAARLKLIGVGLNPSRTALVDVLREMGAAVAVESQVETAGESIGEITVSSGASQLRAVSIGPDRVPALIDELPLLAVAMAAADGTSEVRGAQELRVKESDRIAATAAALAAAGAQVEELPDGWRIRRGHPQAAFIHTHGDHRLAIALAVAAWGGVATSVTLDDPACAAVSYPTFWRDAAALGLTGAGT